MTNVTISISTSQVFRSWVAVFQPSPPIASLFRSLYDIPGLASRMDVLSWGRRDFQISFWNRDTSRNAWNRLWGSFMVDTRISSNNMKFPSHKWLLTFCELTIYNYNSYWSYFVPNSTFYRILSGFHRTFATGVACRQGTLTPPDTWSCPFWDLHLFFLLRPATSYIDNKTSYQFETLLMDITVLLNLTFHQILVSREHMQRVWHAKRGRLLLRTPGPVPLGLAYVLLVETHPFPNLSLFFRTMLVEYPSVLSRFYLILVHLNELKNHQTRRNSICLKNKSIWFVPYIVFVGKIGLHNHASLVKLQKY